MPATKPLVSRRRKKEDPDERALRMRKYRRYAIIAAGACFLLYWGVSFAWDLVPQSENPFPEFTTEEFVEKYSADKDAADAKFAEKVVVISGTIALEQDPGKKNPPRVFFSAAGEKKVEILFHDLDIVAELKEGANYRISGRVTKAKPGSPITLKQANLLQGKAVAAGGPRFDRLARSSAPEKTTLTQIKSGHHGFHTREA